MSTPTNGTAYTADVVLFARNPEGVLCVLLIQRSHTSDAFPGHWALPGGYLDPGESPEHAARRELREETHLITLSVLRRVGYYNTPGRPAWRGREHRLHRRAGPHAHPAG